jgi:hypothetical protein
MLEGTNRRAPTENVIALHIFFPTLYAPVENVLFYPVLSFSIMHFYVLHFTGNISKTQMKK